MLAFRDAEDNFAKSTSYAEFQRQPLHRQEFCRILFDVFAAHPILVLETGYSHQDYGFFYRFRGDRHALYQFNETMRIMEPYRREWSNARIVPAGLDNIRRVVEAIEAEYLPRSVGKVRI